MNERIAVPSKGPDNHHDDASEQPSPSIDVNNESASSRPAAVGHSAAGGLGSSAQSQYVETTRNDTKQKIERKKGTAADGKWTGYDVEVNAKRKRRVLYRTTPLSVGERLAMATSWSMPIRFLCIILVALLVSMVKQSVQIPKIPGSRVLRTKQSKYLDTCASVLSQGVIMDIRAVSTVMQKATDCIAYFHDYALHAVRAQKLQFQPWYIYSICEKRPMLLVALLSMSIVAVAYMWLLVYPPKIPLIEDGGKTILSRVIEKLPSGLSALLSSIENIKFIVNTLVLDAGVFIVTCVLYQLLPLLL